jgi:hypothetical protein
VATRNCNRRTITAYMLRIWVTVSQLRLVSTDIYANCICNPNRQGPWVLLLCTWILSRITWTYDWKVVFGPMSHLQNSLPYDVLRKTVLWLSGTKFRVERNTSIKQMKPFLLLLNSSSKLLDAEINKKPLADKETYIHTYKQITRQKILIL